MDHIRPEAFQQCPHVRHKGLQIDLAHVEPVEMTGPHQQLVTAVADRLKAGTRMRLAVQVVGRTDKQRLVPGLAIGPGQVKRDGLRSTGVKVRMIMCKDKDPHQDTPRDVFTATKKSW